MEGSPANTVDYPHFASVALPALPAPIEAWSPPRWQQFAKFGRLPIVCIGCPPESLPGTIGECQDRGVLNRVLAPLPV